MILSEDEQGIAPNDCPAAVWGDGGAVGWAVMGGFYCSLERISDVFRFPILPLAEGRRLSVFGGDTCRTCCIAPPMEAHSHWFLLLTSHADTQKPSEQDAGTNDHQRGLWGNIRHFDWWSWFTLVVHFYCVHFVLVL